MKNWVTINDRLFEMEAIPEEMRDEEWIKEWNSLLSTKVAGILNRNKYEEPKGKKTREKKEEKREQGENVGSLQDDMAKTSSL